jgi:hypothetical protein
MGSWLQLAWRSVPWMALAGLLFAGCPSRDGSDDRARNGSRAHEPSPPSPSRAGEGSLRQIVARSEVSLTGPRVDARVGDWLLENEGKVAVVNTDGRLVDFGAPAHDDAMVTLEPTVYVGPHDQKAAVVSVGPTPGAANVLRIERRMYDVPLRLWTFVSFAGSALRIESVVTSTGDAAPAVTIGEVVTWGNVPTWVEGIGFVRGAGSFSGDFLAREGLGVAYALGREGGRLVARFNGPASGFHDRPHTGEDPVSVPAGRASPRRAVRLVHAEGMIGDAVAALLKAQDVPLEQMVLPAIAAERAWAEVTRCPDPPASDGAPFARFPLGVAARQVVLPHGCFRVRASAPGHASSAWFAPDEVAGVGAAFEPSAGRLRWHVAAAGETALPSRVLVRGISPTPDPDWGEDPHEGAALEVVYALGDGEVPIPPGKYRVTVSRGFEYTVREQTITIDANRTVAIAATLERVVDTRGWISADLHLHAVPSPDAPTLLEDRVRSLAAAGVEVAVATDHNAVTDYAPTIQSLGAQRWVASIVGDEVTTRGVELGHFNVFPLAAGSAPIRYESTTPRDIFVEARQAAPAGRDKIVQVNHPRMGRIGYFELIHFDDSDFDGWRKRTPLFDSSFDAIEVFNGDDYENLSQVQKCLNDWYALLDAGLRATATGNSDSHKLTYHEPGVPRNFVRVGDDSPEAFDERAFVDAVRRGRVVVSSGPFVRLRAGGADVGDEVAPGDVDVEVRVEAAPWVDVRTVDLVRRGEVVHTWRVDRTAAILRLDARVTLALRSNDWLIAIARGDEPMAFLHRPGARPFAFTNPIRVR